MSLGSDRFHIEAVFERAAQIGPAAAGHAFRAFLLADVDVVQDFLELPFGALGAHLSGRTERIADLNLGDARDGFLHELVEDRFMHQGPRRTGADLALVESEEREALERLVEEGVVLVTS